MFVEKSRANKIGIIEKVLIGDTVLNPDSTDPKVLEFGRMIHDLDNDWFNFMPNGFFVDKFKEEIGEYKDSLKSFYENYEKLESLDLIESARYNVLAELSDAILATSSALFEHKVEESVAISAMRELVNYSFDMSERFGREVFLSTVTKEDVFNAHYLKVKEMADAKNIYRDCIYLNPVSKEWINMLLKIYTLEELMEPRNKMKIVKEIRRMKFALKHIGVTSN